MRVHLKPYLPFIVFLSLATLCFADPTPPTDPPAGWFHAVVTVSYLPPSTPATKENIQQATGELISLNDQGYVYLTKLRDVVPSTQPAGANGKRDKQVSLDATSQPATEVLIPANLLLSIKKVIAPNKR